MTNNISSNGQFLRLQQQTVRLQTKQSDLQFQASSGMKGPAIGDIGVDGVDARRSLSIRSVLNQLDTYKSNITTADTNASVIDTAMNQMNTILDGLQTAFTNLSSDLQSNTAYINQIGRQGLQEMGNLLNTQVDGRYVFAANDVHTAPVGDTNPLMAYAQTQMNNIVNVTVPAAGSVAINNLQSAVGLPASAYAPAANAIFSQSVQYGGPPVKVRIDADRDVSYGIRADAPVFQDMLRAFATAATITYAPNNTAEYNTVLADGLKTVQNAVPILNDEIGKLGMVRADMKTTSKKHDDVTTTLTIARGNLEDADMATVFADMQMNDVATQATYKIIGSMKSVSLLNYLT